MGYGKNNAIPWLHIAMCHIRAQRVCGGGAETHLGVARNIEGEWGGEDIETHNFLGQAEGRTARHTNRGFNRDLKETFINTSLTLIEVTITFITLLND